ncbi:MAG: 4'-phosphopantetheinyl transferase [Saprospiraceae bacterium]|jgi:4'-phosphopantetheinyl transferase
MNTSSVNVVIASIERISKKSFNIYIDTLPNEWRTDILKLQVFDDRKRSLLARLILWDFLNKVNFKNERTISCNEWGKPEIVNAPYFNWSHSGNYVVFAWSEVAEIGIDIEQNKEIEWADFKDFFNKNQWSDISQNDTAKERFYYYWVINEAIIKAKGVGMSFDVKEIGLVSNNLITVSKEDFRLKEIIINPDYICYFAIRSNYKDLNFKQEWFKL